MLDGFELDGEEHLILMDYAEHYVVITGFPSKTPRGIWDTMQLVWVQQFERPLAVQLDAFSSHTSSEFESLLADAGIGAIVTVDKTHYKNGLIEVSILWAKRIMSSLRASYPDRPWSDIRAATAKAMNTLATYVDGRSPHFRVWGKERRIPKSVEEVDPSTSTDENGLIRARPRTERELRDMHHIRAEARRVFQTIAVAEKMSRALHKQNRKAARHLPRAEEVGKLARYHVGAETTVAKQKRGWYDCKVVGATRDAYVLRTGNGRIIQRAAEKVRVLDG